MLLSAVMLIGMSFLNMTGTDKKTQCALYLEAVKAVIRNLKQV